MGITVDILYNGILIWDCIYVDTWLYYIDLTLYIYIHIYIYSVNVYV